MTPSRIAFDPLTERLRRLIVRELADTGSIAEVECQGMKILELLDDADRRNKGAALRVAQDLLQDLQESHDSSVVGNHPATVVSVRLGMILGLVNTTKLMLMRSVSSECLDLLEASPAARKILEMLKGGPSDSNRLSLDQHSERHESLRALDQLHNLGLVEREEEGHLHPRISLSLKGHKALRLLHRD